jgi:hypothetical protein
MNTFRLASIASRTEITPVMMRPDQIAARENARTLMDSGVKAAVPATGVVAVNVVRKSRVGD